VTRLTLVPLCLFVALLNACATLPLAEADPETSEALVTANDGIPVWIEQRSELSEMLVAEHDIEAHAMDNGSLLIRLPAAEGFELASAVPTPTLTSVLDRIVPMLNTHVDTGLKILGHTDSIGSELYNLRLSIERAEAVMDYLRARGVALGRLSADGRGEAEPIADNATESGRAINRRVEIVVRPLD